MYSELKQVEQPIVQVLESLGWQYIPSSTLQPLRSTYENPFVDQYLADAIIKLNSLKGVTELHTEAILHRLKRIESNEEFSIWIKGEKSFKLSQHEKAVTIKLIDFDDLSNNQFTVTNQFKQSITNAANENEKHIIPDIVLLINGIPVTIIECKVLSTEQSIWEEGYRQLKRYQRVSPALFVPNIFNVSTDGHDLRYGATSAPEQYYFEWKNEPAEIGEEFNPYIDKAVKGLFNHKTYLDLLSNFVVFETTDDKTIKKIARYQQVRATNKIVNRVLDEEMKSGLIWHTQGSGKSLTMLFTAWKLRKHPSLNNPTVLIVVDRKDLDTQISGTFQAAGLPNTTRADSIRGLKQKLRDDRREVIITTVFKFAEMKDILLERENIIVLIDEAHRSQEGLNAIEMRASIPNAYFFGFTGTPIDRSDHNTHRNFGLKSDNKIERYLDLYKIRQAIDDGATVPVHYQFRNSQWHLDGANVDRIVEEEYPDLPEDQLDALKEKTASYYTFMMKPERLCSIAEDIAKHFKAHVEPNGYKAQVVCYTRRAAVIIKEHLDEILGPECSDIVFTGAQNDDDQLRRYHYSGEKKKDLVRYFKDENHPLKVLLVQSMLLTGFDAPVEQVMYLDRPLRDHTLLQAIARTNRPYKEKQCGLIIDYCGILKRLKDALNFNEEEIEDCLIDFDVLKARLPDLIEEIKAIFAGIDISNLWHCLRHLEQDKAAEARFSELFRHLQATYETIAPDPFVLDYQADYKWATELMLAWKQMHRPPTEKVPEEYLAHTRRLIQEHIDLSRIDQAAPLFVIDDNYLRRIDELPPDREQRELLIEKRLRYMLSVRIGNLPVYRSLMERLEAIIKQKKEDSQLTMELLTDLVGDVNSAIKEEEALHLSKGTLALRQLVSKKITYSKPDELADRIDSVVADHTFPGWQVQSTVEATIKRDIIMELAKFAKDHPEADLDPDDFSEISKEALQYIERYY